MTDEIMNGPIKEVRVAAKRAERSRAACFSGTDGWIGFELWGRTIDYLGYRFGGYRRDW